MTMIIIILTKLVLNHETAFDEVVNIKVRRSLQHNSESARLTLKRPGGGSPPQDFRVLAVLSETKLWLSKLHVIIIFNAA